MSQESLRMDPMVFARDGEHRSGVRRVSDFPRLAVSAAGGEGNEVAFEFRGERDRDGKSYLLLDAQGVIVLRCQRCLEPMEWPFSIASRLMLVREGGALPDDLEVEEYDAVEVSQSEDFFALLEDEILLALPLAPRHQSCEAPRSGEVASSQSPFAGLANLRNGKGKV